MTNAELAILSLVGEAPRHGYEIEQTIEARGMREWTEIGFSSIYYVLKKLEKNGYIESQLCPPAGRGPARRVFRITPEGRAALTAATRSTLAEPQPTYSALSLGLANLPLLPREEALDALNTYRESLVQHRLHVLARAEVQGPLPLHVELVFDYGLTLLTAEIDWIEKAMNELKENKNGQG